MTVSGMLHRAHPPLCLTITIACGRPGMFAIYICCAAECLAVSRYGLIATALQTLQQNQRAAARWTALIFALP